MSIADVLNTVDDPARAPDDGGIADIRTSISLFLFLFYVKMCGSHLATGSNPH